MGRTIEPVERTLSLLRPRLGVRFGPVSLHGRLWAAGLRSCLRVAVVLGRVDAGYSFPLYTLAGTVRHLHRPLSMGIAVAGEARSVPMR